MLKEDGFRKWISKLWFARETKYLKTYRKKKSTDFWDVSPYSLVEVGPLFGETYRLHFQVE